MTAVGVLWPSRGGSSSSPATVTFVSEQHVTNVSGTTHTYSSITGLQTGDIMLLFTGGVWYVPTAPTGWTQFAADSGGATVAISVYAKVATSSSETVTATFSGGNVANISTIVVLRGGTAAWKFSEQSYGGSNNTTALTFPSQAPTAGSTQVGMTLSPAAALGIMFIHGATTGITYTPSPTATSTIFSISVPGSRTAHCFIVPASSSYSATPSASDYKGGAVVLVG